jgi:hypothetical protein
MCIKNKNSHFEKEPLGLCTMMMGGLSRLDKFENVHVSSGSGNDPIHS